MSKDLFSKQSATYAKYRPGYPPALTEYILQYVHGREKAWDCATGNGQAALELAQHFQLVEATDISETQISNAVKHPSIHYSVSGAEQTQFPDAFFDLITVAQAYHWFNFTAFEREAKRVSKPDGIIAVWGYSLVQCEEKNLNERIRAFYTDIVGPYWDAERKFVDNHYRDIPFPFDELPATEFSMEQKWKLDDLAGYLNTWSSVQHFIKSRGFNPVDEFRPEIKKAWSADEHLKFSFPVFLRLGTIRK